MKKGYLVTLVGLGAVMAGCSSIPGPTESSTPPQMISAEGEPPIWNRASRFGPLPDSMQALGNSTCASVGLNVAIGYHAKAVDINGRPIKGGGFLCEGEVETVAQRDYRAQRRIGIADNSAKPGNVTTN